ncbi:MAG: L-rhamnose isomerase [Erysipelotrichia bacterium]|nr:L-rhamnose isomerase [Erysipelotrichia bacterium]
MSYLEAKEKYRKIGVDIEKAMERVNNIPISLHCWQGDDVRGFINNNELSGGIQTTGNYPGRARNFEELTKDLDVVYSLLPGKKRLALHAIYAVSEEKVELDKLKIEHFEPWIEWASKKGIHLDFNPTCFSHEMVKDGLTLSSPEEKIRKFWIEHIKCCRAIAAEIGKRQGTPCLNNIWIPDGLKNTPTDRLTPRLRLKESLDEIFAVKYPQEYLLDSLESKLFGIGVESYTVGNSEFYQNYAAQNKLCCLLDNGHYHPTECVSDKIPSMLVFYDKVALHVTRGVRWDSDHVVLLEDEVIEIAKEIIRNNADHKVLIGLDYFDASINRIAAWTLGYLSMRKALLYAALLPNDELKQLQDENNFTKIMCLTEKLKSYAFDEVWEEYLKRNKIEEDIYEVIHRYENEVLINRK